MTRALAVAPVTDVITWPRTTRLRRSDGAVVIVPNGLIVQMTNLSREWARAVVDVPLPAGADVLEANELLRRVGAEAFEDEDLRPLLLSLLFVAVLVLYLLVRASNNRDDLHLIRAHPTVDDDHRKRHDPALSRSGRSLKEQGGQGPGSHVDRVPGLLPVGRVQRTLEA